MSIKILAKIPNTKPFLTQLKLTLKMYRDLNNYYFYFTIKIDKNKGLFTKKILKLLFEDNIKQDNLFA